MRTRKPHIAIALLGLLLLSLLGCNGTPQPQSEASLRIAVLPILDSLPLYVAASEGIFTDEGINVTLVPVASAAERDQLLQAGQVDIAITDLVALVLYNRDAVNDTPPQVIAVRTAMVPTPQFAQFRIVAAASSEIHNPGDLRGVAIGVSEGTVIEYVTARLLEAEGLHPDEIIPLAVPKIPERMALLNAGELAAATLPEPLASLAIQQGARVIVDDRIHPQVSCSLYAVRADVLQRHPAAVRALLRAIDQASLAVNADKARWSALLSDKQLVPPALAGKYVLPDYPTSTVPRAAQFQDVVAWLQANGRLDTSPSYADVVSAAYLK